MTAPHVRRDLDRAAAGDGRGTGGWRGERAMSWAVGSDALERTP